MEEDCSRSFLPRAFPFRCVSSPSSADVLSVGRRLSKEVFDTDRGLWLATKEQEIYPNPHSYAKESNQLSWFTFLGRIVGKALYQGILIDVRFAAFFLAKVNCSLSSATSATPADSQLVSQWLGKQSYLDDLASLDPELYAGLLKLKTYPGNVEEDLSLNFTVTDEGMLITFPDLSSFY